MIGDMRRIGERLLLFCIGAFLIYLMIVPPDRSVNDGKTHVRYWFVSGPDEQIPYRVTQFNKTHKDIVIDATPIPWNEHEKKVLTAILSGDPPDVVSLVAPVQQWATRMALIPLNNLIKKDNFDSTYTFPALWREVNYEGYVFALPTHTASYAFFYNKKLFREAGLDPNKPPKTWDQVREYSKRLTKMENGNYKQIGFIPIYGNLFIAVLMAQELGAKFLSDDGKTVHLDNKQMIESLQWILNYYSDYNFNKLTAFQLGFGYADQHGFISEKVAMMVLDHTFLDAIDMYKPDLDFGVTAIPTFEGYQTASSTGNWWMAIPRGAKNVEAAWKFMKFSVSEKVQIKESEGMKQRLLPANINAAKDTALTNHKKFYDVLIEQMKYAKTPSIVPLVNGTFWREFALAEERAIRHKQTPKLALEQANKVVQKDLNRAKQYDDYVWANMKLEDFQ